MHERMFGMLFIVPATILLTLSFFILYVLRKIAVSPLKVFGYAVVGLLWISSLCTFTGGVVTAAKIHCRRNKMHSWMKDKMNKAEYGIKKRWPQPVLMRPSGTYETVFEDDR